MSANIHREYCALLEAAARRASDAQRSNAATLILRLRERLMQPPRIMLLGEINSGKSSLANLLIGESVVPTSVVANSHFPMRFHYAALPVLSAVFEDGLRRVLPWTQIERLAQMPVARLDVGLPIERLRTFEVIDTPGSGNPKREGGLERPWPRAHLAIWCTVAARAWKESENAEWLQRSHAHRARGVLALTQVDLLPGPEDLGKVLTRLHSATAEFFTAIVPLATNAAIAASVAGSEAQPEARWVDLGGALLESTIMTALAGIAEQRVTSAKRALYRAFTRERVSTTANANSARRGGLAGGLGIDLFEGLVSDQMDALALLPSAASARPRESVEVEVSSRTARVGAG